MLAGLSRTDSAWKPWFRVIPGGQSVFGHDLGVIVRGIAVLMATLLAGVAQLTGPAHAAGEAAPVSGVQVSGAPAPGVQVPVAADGSPQQMFSEEWREQKVREREAHLRALDAEQSRFDRWERSARQAVGGICADCLGARSGHSVTIPGDAIPNVPSSAAGIAGFDETSAYYVVAPAPQSPPVSARSPLPAAPRAAVSASASAPLDIRTPAGR